MFKTFSDQQDPKIHGKTNKIAISTTLKIRTNKQSIAKSWEDFLQTVDGERTGLKCVISGIHLMAHLKFLAMCVTPLPFVAFIPE